ncbi:MAG: hypothetical protein KIS76_00395 [Pyrinomonadaceae bacterium]|nr:hypothetical protein [Pyrinomonadaceae bacterium]
MNLQNLIRKGIGAFFAAIFCFAITSSAQMGQDANNYLLCAGYIESGTIDTSRKIVGANDEKEQNIISQGDYVYLNFSSGVSEGDMFSIVRPRGKVNSRWTNKRDLGFFVQEVGTVEIIKIQNGVSVAQVKTSCDNMLYGDLVRPMPSRTPVSTDMRPDFDMFSSPSGKQKGNIVLARDNQEMVTANQVVYIDLGSEDNIKMGDYLTIFRPLGTGNILDDLPSESVSARDAGFQSTEYRGGKFSNQAARKSGDKANGTVVTSKKAKRDRPDGLRRVVGEMVVINVNGKTATGVIIRTAGEIHTGDNVELQ